MKTCKKRSRTVQVESLTNTELPGSGPGPDRGQPHEGPGDEAADQAAQLSQLHPGVLLTRGCRGGKTMFNDKSVGLGKISGRDKNYFQLDKKLTI